MPVHLEPLDVSADLGNARSALIVSCPICPPVSLALQNDSQLIEFFKRGIKTRAFEDYIKTLRATLEQRGVRTGEFCAYTPCPTMCLWTEGQRRRLLKRARDYDAVLVLGCESATYTVDETLKDTGCRVIQAMRTTGLANATVRFRFPLTVDVQHNADVHAGSELENVVT